MSGLDREICYRALQTRDERFDGRLFVGVTSTGIYCRPTCPARPARREKCRFFPSAAAAAAAGFRPCLRCRPETAPEVGAWRGSANTVARGLALIADGDLDRAEASVEALAERLGVGGRQLRRLFEQHLGASPIAVAQTRRVLFAKQLVHETDLPMTEVALAAGFGSVRRFNETFQRLFDRPPSALRRRAVDAPTSDAVTVRLRYQRPYDHDALLAHFAARAIEGVEVVDGGVYRRSIDLPDKGAGTIAVAHLPARGCVAVTVRVASVRALPVVVARVRRLFDLDADVRAIAEHLGSDPWLAPLFARRPGLRVAGAWDGFELAVRAVLGQQISVAAARKLAGALVRLCGRPLAGPAEPGLARTFPDAAAVAAADLGALPMPRARQAALHAVATAALADPDLFQRRATVEETVARLETIAGVGAWTAQYIALRAARDPDAFPVTDRALLRGAERVGGCALTAAALADRAARWRPFRAYAAQHLWTGDADAT